MTVETSIDGIDNSSAIVSFYDGKVFMNEDDRKQAITEGRMTESDADYHIVPFVKIKFIGRSDMLTDRPAHTEGGGEFIADPDRFPKQWAAYRDKTAAPTGTALSVLTALNEGDVVYLDEKSIRSVEALENLQDSHLAGLGMGMRRYRDIARAWRAAQPLVVNDPAAASEIARLTAIVEEMQAKRWPARDKKELNDA